MKLTNLKRIIRSRPSYRKPESDTDFEEVGSLCSDGSDPVGAEDSPVSKGKTKSVKKTSSSKKSSASKKGQSKSHAKSQPKSQEFDLPPLTPRESLRRPVVKLNQPVTSDEKAEDENDLNNGDVSYADLYGCEPESEEAFVNGKEENELNASSAHSTGSSGVRRSRRYSVDSAGISLMRIKRSVSIDENDEEDDEDHGMVAAVQFCIPQINPLEEKVEEKEEKKETKEKKNKKEKKDKKKDNMGLSKSMHRQPSFRGRRHSLTSAPSLSCRNLMRRNSKTDATDIGSKTDATDMGSSPALNPTPSAGQLTRRDSKTGTEAGSNERPSMLTPSFSSRALMRRNSRAGETSDGRPAMLTPSFSSRQLMRRNSKAGDTPADLRPALQREDSCLSNNDSNHGTQGNVGYTGYSMNDKKDTRPLLQRESSCASFSSNASRRLRRQSLDHGYSGDGSSHGNDSPRGPDSLRASRRGSAMAGLSSSVHVAATAEASSLRSSVRSSRGGLDGSIRGAPSRGRRAPRRTKSSDGMLQMAAIASSTIVRSTEALPSASGHSTTGRAVGRRASLTGNGGDSGQNMRSSFRSSLRGRNVPRRASNGGGERMLQSYKMAQSTPECDLKACSDALIAELGDIDLSDSEDSFGG